MTTAADDAAVEDAFEAILAGRAAPEGAAGLAAFTEAVRATATPPGRPSAALADLLASGLLVDQSSPSTRTARSAGGPPSRGSRSRIRRRFAMILPALLAKLLAGGALAQAATGATVVVVAVTGAGAAGALPGPVQDRFAAVVQVVTPFEAPTSEDEGTTGEEAPADGLPVEEEAPVGEVPVVDEDRSEVPAEPPAEEPTADEVVAEWMGQEIEGSFGAWVSAARHDPALLAAIEETGHNFGYYVSRRAQERGLSDDDLAAEGVDVGETDGEGSEVAETPVDDDQAQSPAPTRGQRSGHGNGGGSGNQGSGGGGNGGGDQGHGGGGHGGGGNGGGGNGGGRG